MRGFLFGLVLLVGLTVSVLSLRPGGLRRQLRFIVRRFRIVLALGGIFLLGSSIVRLVFPNGAVADWGPPALALVLGGVFVVLAQDPAATQPGTHTSTGGERDG
ncbi:MAG: hypothetical protein NVS9B11_16910 [Candidatus Dormibacteraceae bacterium]